MINNIDTTTYLWWIEQSKVTVVIIKVGQSTGVLSYFDDGGCLSYQLDTLCYIGM